MKHDEQFKNKQDIKVLMFVPQYPFPIVGGLERQSHELSKALGRQGVNVTVLSGRINGVGPANEVVEGVRIIRLPWSPVKWIRGPQTTIVLVWNMFLNRVGYDIVHIHNISWVGGVVVITAKMFRKMVLVKLPNVGEFGIPGRKKKFLGQLLLNILKKADVMIALSDESVRELNKANYPDCRILKITNGVSTVDYFGGDSKKNGNPVKVLFSGRLSPEKGLLDLISVWSKIVQESPQPVVLEICGEGPQRQEILDTANILGIANMVNLCGHVNDMASVLRKADIFVLPSYAEGNSNAILEAMASGLPIISTRVGGTARLVGNKGAEFLFTPGDRERLAHCLYTLVSGRDARKALGKAMRERAVNYFDIDKTADRYRLAYEHLVGSGSGVSVSSFSSPIFEDCI